MIRVRTLIPDWNFLEHTIWPIVIYLQSLAHMFAEKWP